MRLIDAEHLKRWIIARWEETDQTSPYPLRTIDIIDQVDREDTIDAEPVRHGGWMSRTNELKHPSWYSCSECGGQFNYKWKFCPNCGAKMEVDND